ncbi:MAG TPA: glycosyl hydrolase family 18 protein [Terriglobales bacterium]|nr:glycosyl hydrolase family 18 protein [Terriglobales bacterium]
MNSIRSLRFLCSLALASVLVLGSAFAQSAPVTSKRVIYYYQTQYYQGKYVSLSKIWKQVSPKTHKPITTDVMVAAFHLGYDSNNQPYIHLNDNVPSDPMFTVMWRQVATLQKNGVNVRMMLGGAAQGSYANLFSNWNTFYPILRQTLRQYHLDGIDMDIEEQVALTDAQKLVHHLNKDFSKQFIMTMSPVAPDLSGYVGFSGFNYKDLYGSSEGKRINWFNGQFYCGWGTLATTTDYELIIKNGYPPEKIVGGMIGNPANCSGYVPIPTVAKTVKELVAMYPRFGGVADWEYFNTLPGGLANPVKWGAIMAKAMGN